MSLIAIIPARAGSKGVPGKNTRLLAGRPLVAYTIDAALTSNCFAAVYVTSDDPIVLNLAIAQGAQAIQRPTELADDHSSMNAVIRHVLDHLSAGGHVMGDAFALLQPTSPLRSAQHLKEAAALFAKGDCQSVVGVCRNEHPPQKSLAIGKNGHLSPLWTWESLHANRQDLGESYRQNGALWLLRWEAFQATGRFVVDPALPYVMNAADSVDIDSLDDFEAAEAILRGQTG